jgi:hypothetical protein
VAWEQRRNGNLYYYRSVRDGERVKKEYLGRGEVAQLIAHADETRRRVREARRKQVREELARMEEIMAPVLEIDEATRVLIRAHLVAGGYHRRRGEWRRERST